MTVEDIKKLSKSEMINYLYVRDIIKGNDNDNIITPVKNSYLLYIILSIIIILIMIILYVNTIS
jgi:hypothetical protein